MKVGVSKNEPSPFHLMIFEWLVSNQMELVREDLKFGEIFVEVRILTSQKSITAMHFANFYGAKQISRFLLIGLLSR
jgi:hypothetical protein